MKAIAVLVVTPVLLAQTHNRPGGRPKVIRRTYGIEGGGGMAGGPQAANMQRGHNARKE